MQLKHIIGRSIFSLFGALLLGGILAGGLGLLIGFISLLGTVFVPPISLPAAFIGAIVGGGFGFLYGSYHGFKIGNYFYQKYIEKIPAIAEPTFLSGRDDLITPSNALIREIRQLPAAMHLPFLTKDEIAKYREIISDQDDRNARKKLNYYEDFIKDLEHLSIKSDNELKIQFPLTIEHTKEPKSHARTYERDFVLDIIDKQKDQAKEPLKGYFLTSPHIHFYSGFPIWIRNFIASVRNILKIHASNNSPEPIIKEKESKKIVVSPKSLFQPEQNIPENIDKRIEAYNQKYGRRKFI